MFAIMSLILCASYILFACGVAFLLTRIFRHSKKPQLHIIIGMIVVGILGTAYGEASTFVGGLNVPLVHYLDILGPTIIALIVIAMIVAGIVALVEQFT